MMKQTVFTTLLILLIVTTQFSSCIKEKSCEGCVNGNHPPIASAGKDTLIKLPANTVTLDGSASSDPDNDILSYQWTKISGPASGNISNSKTVQTQLTNLEEGVYIIELKVTDAVGLIDTDTIQITVDAIISICNGLTIQWQKKLGGMSYEPYDQDWYYPCSILPTTDGGYLLAGTSDDGAFGGQEGILLMKLNSIGTIEWQKLLGGSWIDQFFSIQSTMDGGYILAGYTNSNNGDVSGNHGALDLWLVKLSNTGVIQWQKSLGGSFIEGNASVKQTADGGFILAGYTDSFDDDVSGNHGNYDWWLVKLNGNGVLQWQKTLGGTGNDWGNISIDITADEGYILAGTTSSNDGDVSGNHGNEDVWLVKLGNTGEMQWEKTLGGSGNDDAYSIQHTADGGFILAAGTNSTDGDVSGNHGGEDAWLIKLSSQGSIQWQRTLGGINNDDIYSVQQTKDGGYILTGGTNSTDGDVSGNHGSTDLWLVKLNNSGDTQWQKSFGGTGFDIGITVLQTTDEGFLLAGYSDSKDGDVVGTYDRNDIWILKVKECQ